MASRAPRVRKAKADARALPTNYLTCRLKHSWDFQGFYHHRGGIAAIHDCVVCPTRSLTLYDRGMNRLGCRYEYPDDYLVKGGADRLEVRRELLSRVKVSELKDPKR